MEYSSLVARITGEGADAWQIHYAACAARDRGEDVIILSVGDPDLDTPQPVLERAIECLRAGDTHYTPVAGRELLREAIARAHRARTGQEVEADNVIFLAGAQNALFAASLCLAGPDDEVIALEPLYPTYPATIEVSGARMVRVPAPAASGFRVDLAALEAAITPRTRALFFATPNNPSGVILSAPELSFIGELARRHALWVVADEVYAGLAPGGRVPSLATQPSRSDGHDQQPFQNTCDARLARGLAGGTEAPGRSCRSARDLHAVWSAGVYPRSRLDGASASPPRRNPGFANSARAGAIFCSRVSPAYPKSAAMLPEAGMFMLLDVRAIGMSGYDFMCELYRSEGVSVLDGGAFGGGTAGFVRVCFATDEATLREACVRIRRFVERQR